MPPRPPQTKMPLPSKLTLVSLYAIVATIGISHLFVRDVSNQLRQKNQFDDGFYEKHFLPSESTTRPRHNNNTITTSAAANKPKFPIKTHIVTQGKPRTATTLLFNMVAVSYFLYLVENDPATIPEVELSYWQRPRGYKTLRRTDTPIVIKAHLSLDNFLSENAVVFTAAVDELEASDMRSRLEKEGHTVAFVQDMETVKNGGVPELVREYIAGYGLSEKDEAILNEYFSKWEILRQCCGQQMSMRYRNDMVS